MIAGLLQILYWSCLFLQRKFYFKTKFYNLHLRVINRVVFNFKCKNCNVISCHSGILIIVTIYGTPAVHFT